MPKAPKPRPREVLMPYKDPEVRRARHQEYMSWPLPATSNPKYNLSFFTPVPVSTGGDRHGEEAD